MTNRKQSASQKAASSKKIQELTDQLTDAEYTLVKEKNTMSTDKKNQYYALIEKLSLALKEEKIKNYDQDAKTKAQMIIMLELKRRNEEKDRKITMLEKNSIAVNPKEISKKIKEVNDDVISERLIKSTKRKYDNYIDEWLNERSGIEESAKKKR